MRRMAEGSVRYMQHQMAHTRDGSGLPPGSCRAAVGWATPITLNAGQPLGRGRIDRGRWTVGKKRMVFFGWIKSGIVFDSFMVLCLIIWRGLIYLYSRRRRLTLGIKKAGKVLLPLNQTSCKYNMAIKNIDCRRNREKRRRGCG